MKKFYRILVLVLSLVMIFSAFAVTASAAATELDIVVEVTKDFHADFCPLTSKEEAYMALPNVTFTFTMTPGAGSADGTIKEGVSLSNNTVTITYDNNTEIDSVTHAATKKAEIKAKGTFSTPGKYHYEIVEEHTNIEFLEEGGELYNVYVYVGYKDDTNELEVKAITIHNADGDKAPPVFANAVYNTTGSASKTVTGNMGDKEKEFAFTLKTTANDYYSDGVELGIKFSDGTYDTFVVGTDYSFTMAHGESVQFDLPAMLEYTVEEADYSAIDNGNGGYTTTVNGTAGRTFTSVSEGDSAANVADFVNDKTITITGVFMSYGPYIAVIVVAVLAIALFALSKKRKASEA